MKYLLSIILTVAGWQVLSAQRIDTLMHMYSSAYPKEKVFLQLDRSAYNTGESIWYKAYVFLDNYPSLLSKNLYVELVDDKGNVLDRNLAPLTESTASGSFSIAKTYKSSYIYVRAYTRYMLNYDSSFIFFKPLRVLDNPLAAAKGAGGVHTVLRFFPEGGDLITGVESRIAFKASENGDGYPDSVQGVIVDGKGVRQASFASVKDGMGTFSMTPVKGETYTAKWKDKNNLPHTTPLPEAKPYGAVLRVDSRDSSKIYTVTCSSADTTQSVYHVVAHTGGQVFYMATFRLVDGQTLTQSIATDLLPSGIVTVSLFNEDWQPVAERISFVDNNEYMFYPAIHPIYIKFDKRAENSFEVDYADTIKSNCSISVTDADLDAPVDDKTDNIISALLLTSDLRGRVYNPWDYLSNPVDSVRHEVDLVMLTNGWRRFHWDDLIHKQYHQLRYPPDGYMSMQGEIFGISDKRGIGTINIISDGGGSHNRFMFAEVDTAGKFQVDNFYMYGQQRLFYQFNKKDQYGGATVSIGNGLYRGDKKIAVTDSMLADVQIPDPRLVQNDRAFVRYSDSVIKNTPKIKQLQTIIIKAPSKSPEQVLDEKYTSGMFTGGDGYQFDVADDPAAQASMSVFQYLQGRVAGLQITDNGAQTSLTWRGGSPGLYLDENSADVSTLKSIPMTDVAFIKVFRPPFMGGFGGGNGGIAVYTKKGGSSAPSDAVKAMESTVIVGYTPLKEFYSPDYATPLPQHDTSDLRATIYWQPYMLFDKSTRHVKVDFYNNDMTKRFRVVLEGITADGRWAYKSVIIDGINDK